MRKAREPNDKLDRATDKTLAEADRKALHGLQLNSVPHIAYGFNGVYISVSKEVNKSFIVCSISQRLNLRHECELLGGTEGLLTTVGFKKTTEGT